MAKLPYTPNSQIRSAMRKLFLRSRERAAAVKRDGYTCQRCGAKQSRRKGAEVFVECHHKEGVLNWQKLFDAVREYLLCNPEQLETLCKGCHAVEGEGDPLGGLWEGASPVEETDPFEGC